jgi:hypothetical protein
MLPAHSTRSLADRQGDTDMSVRLSPKAVLAVALGVLGLAGLRPTTGAAQSSTAVDRVPILPQKVQARRLLNPSARSASSPIAQLAAINEVTAARFAELAQDPSLWVDTTGRAFYIEEPSPLPPAGPALAAAAPDVAFAPENVFSLHSKPGSSKTIFLDFDGHVLGPNAFVANGFEALPMDFDMNPSTFSVQEREWIEGVWARVAEDFAPFDIDVTTEDPGPLALDRANSADTVYGARALITNTSSDTVCSFDCGGVAYVGTFNIPGENEFFQPAWIFPKELASYNEKHTAEAVSHEVGHNLNLNHDGRKDASNQLVDEYYGGHGSWAPILGVGYSRPLTQFSRGEYAGANNQQDDYAQIAGEGVSLVVDEAGPATATATSLGAGPTFTRAGVISAPTDVDMYSFSATTGQTISFTATPALVSPNLDILLRLHNSTGTVIGSYDPPSATVSSDEASGLDATFSVVAPSTGTFYVSIDGVGKGDALADGYTDYGSLGRYTLTGSVSIADTTNPVVTIQTPVPALATTLQGTATDAGGIVYAQAIIYRGFGGGQFWNGTGWQNGYAAVAATLSAPGATSTNWSYVFDPPQSGGTYYVAGLGLDDSLNYAISPFVAFTIPDSVTPTATVSSPVNGATVGSSLNISGTATDNNAIFGVNLAVYRASDATFWNGSSWQAGFVTFAGTTAAPGTASTGFTGSISGLTSGYYLVAALPIDENDNYSLSPWDTVLVPSQ